MSLADNTWAFAKVLEDVILRNRQGKSVILYTRTSKFESIAPDTLGWDQIYAIMRDLLAADVVIVTCAGDEPKRASLPSRVPAAWASREFPVIVAGAVTNDGNYAKFSQGIGISPGIAWAPGNDVVCASNVSSLNQKGQGTAFAAGMVCISTSNTALDP